MECLYVAVESTYYNFKHAKENEIAKYEFV